MIWFCCSIILLLVMLSAVFSGSETALTTVSRARIQHLSKEGSYNAQLIMQLQLEMDKLLSTILLANNFVNILATSIATSIFIEFFSQGGIGLATLIMTIVLIVFAEVMPKVYALQNAEKVALKIAPFLSLSFRVLAPIASRIQRFVNWLWSKVGLTPLTSKDPLSTKKEILAVLDISQETHVPIEHRMVREILDLSNSKITDVMKPKEAVVTVNGDDPILEVIPHLLKTPYSRFPVWLEHKDNIIGVIHIRFLTKSVVEKKPSSKKVKDLITTPPWLVYETTSLLHQLQQFKLQRHHMALIINSLGTFIGILTLEDVLEEIVGDIHDETDGYGHLVYPDLKGGYIVDGMASPKQINQILGWALPEDETKTIMGLIQQENPSFLKNRSQLEIAGYVFKPHILQGHDINWIHISPKIKS